METKTLVSFADDDKDGDDLVQMARQGINKAIEANETVAKHQMEVLSMQAHETQALLQDGNLSEEQFERVMRESERLRQSMAEASTRLYVSNFELVLGACAILVFGGALFKLRVA
jgi:flagellar biosynthesis component FlhA